MHANLMGYVWFQEKKKKKREKKALMFTKLGSKSLAANNYRINEDPENNSRGCCCKYMHVNISKTHAC